MLHKSIREVHSFSSLKLQITPVSKIVFESSQIKWIVDISIKLQNIGKEPLYLPNPLDFYMSQVCFRFFLISADDKKIENELITITPILSKNSWIKLEAGEDINFSKRIVIMKSSEINSDAKNTKEEEQKSEIRFFLNNLLDRKYKLFISFTYAKQHLEWWQKWLGLIKMPSNELELSKFWYGEIVSNYLSIDLTEMGADLNIRN